ncbi:BCL-6 corepressor-like protein 1 [Galleria mellonella]|uniref:BCL-6 corepressor-like protein 1 n=1 Tax=Galleria mellonella TaxID=7137 RepID=A0A6J3CAE8_GALME|nr:BCL-6 corepressor-like protein 1 [Galleria mellonella]
MAKNRMIYLLLTIASITQLGLTAVRKGKPNQIASLLRSILSPTSSSNAMDILQMAAIGTPEVVMPKAARQLPVRSLTEAKRVHVPQQVIGQPIIQEVAMPMPVAPCLSPMQEVYSMPAVPYPVQMVQNKVYPYAFPSPCSCPSPAPLVNPFLPAASPVSALAPPTSNMLPPINPTQVRSHFLRKIPIPPPSL